MAQTVTYYSRKLKDAEKKDAMEAVSSILFPIDTCRSEKVCQLPVKSVR